MRLLWEPAIYEHKAALIDATPGEVSRSSELLGKALIEEFAVYRADYMTVGIDVYNIEAESAGAVAEDTDSRSCPEIRTPPFSLETFDPPAPPDPRVAGRYAVTISAAKIASKNIGPASHLRIAASGPVSIASKLVGMEPLVIALAMEDPAADAVLDFAEALTIGWTERIRHSGFDAIVFDSASAPPVLSPSLYVEKIMPRHARIMGNLTNLGQTERPLIIGGNTTEMIDSIVATGANMVICDYAADAGAFSAALESSAGAGVIVRRNVNPALFVDNESDVSGAAGTLRKELSLFEHPVAGTGILPYDADPRRYLQFRDLVSNR